MLISFIGNYILGDSAYPLSLNLITPFKDNGHLSNAQKKFNKIHSTCRVSIENSFARLKQRFRQLYHLKLVSPLRICHFIKACCVLHNMSINDKVLFANEENPEDLQPENEAICEVVLGNTAAVQLRNDICRILYTR